MANDQQESIMTLSEVSLYLKLSEKTLLKMVKNGEIPCTKIGNQWRFMKEVLDDWLVTRMSTESRGDLSRLVSPEYEVVLLSRLLSPRLIVTDIGDTVKEKVLERLARLAEAHDVVTDGEELLSRLLERESLASTAVGSGFAMPHPRRPDPALVKVPRLLVGVSSEGVAFNAYDGGKTHLFFLILSTNDALHLRVMSRLSSYLRDEELLRSLQGCREPAEVQQIIVEKERRQIGGSER